MKTKPNPKARARFISDGNDYTITPPKPKQKAFDESDVNRDPEGQFAEQAGGGAADGDGGDDGSSLEGTEHPVDTLETFGDFSDNKNVFGKEYTPEQVAALTGINSLPVDNTNPLNIDVEYDEDSNIVSAHVSGLNFEMSRSYLKENDKLVGVNSVFNVSPDAQGTGIATRMFSNEVDTLRTAGFSKIRTTAVRDANQNGYYTWARLGYDADIPSRVASNLPSNLSSASRISDLMKTQEGRDFWSNEGVSTIMEFDLDSSSVSSMVLDEYIRSRGSKSVALKRPTKQQEDIENPPELTEEDDKLIAEIWDKIAAEEAEAKPDDKSKTKQGVNDGKQ